MGRECGKGDHAVPQGLGSCLCSTDCIVRDLPSANSDGSDDDGPEDCVWVQLVRDVDLGWEKARNDHDE
jgi:hypothetical protein